MKKIFNLNIRNIKGSPIFTLVGVVAGLALPIISEHVDTETIGGSLVLIVVGALAGTKKVEVKSEAEKAEETAKEYIEKLKEEREEIKEAVKTFKKK